jgi:hypothetical protein
MSGEIDPTANVIALNEAANKRQDDLRQAAEKLTDSKIADLDKRITTSANHQRELAKAEAARLDSIRAVDREELVKTARAVVDTTEAIRKQQEATTSEQNKRLLALELGQSASGAGTAGEKSGRLSQQDLIKYVIYLILAAILIAGYLKKG